MTKPLSDASTVLKAPQFYVVIPARYASARLPAKSLLDIAGKPMVVWVAERATQSGAAQVIVATDDARIKQAVEQHGYGALMTSAAHLSGTDRIAEVALQQAWSDETIVVNVQGDEPLIEPSLIAEVAALLNRNEQAAMATACHVIDKKADYLNPNVVKVVLDAQAYAMYFSRAPIPYNRGALAELEWPHSMVAYRHVGIYAYRVKFLKQYASSLPGTLEQIECLEQLRALQQGHKIAVHISGRAPASGVDTQEDLDAVRACFQSKLKP